MIYILFSLIVLIPVFVGFGEIFQKTFGRFSFGIAAKIFTGMLTVSVIWTIFSFFTPLNIAIELSTVSVGLIAFFTYGVYDKFWQFLRGVNRSFYILGLVTVFFAAYAPFILDHFGYYIPTIKWIAEVGLVQGISNLDLLLGQISVWHILQGGFSHFSDPFLRLNAVAGIAYLIYIYEKNVWIHLVFLPFLFLFIQSPSPDFPAVVFSLIILSEVLRGPKNPGLLFTFSVLVFAIKPTMIWLPIFVVMYVLFLSKSSFKVLAPGIILLCVFLFKTVWAFGYPVFPVQVFDLGFSWKPNEELLENSAQMAVQKTYDMKFTAAEIENFSLLDRIKNWLFLDGIKGKIHLLFIISIFVFLIYAIKKNSKLIWLLFIAVFIKIVMVLVFSAQYRFFLDVFFVIALVLFYQKFSQKTPLMIFAVLSVLLGVFLSFPNVLKTAVPTFRPGNFMTGFKTEQLYKPYHFKLEKFKTYQLGNLRFNVVQNYPFSFDTPLPAISPQFIQEDLDAGIFPQLKGKTLKEGFIWRNISEEEKIQIQNILDEWAAENHD